MTARMNFLGLILLESILTAADHTSSSVTQTPKEITVNREEDVTFHCTFPSSRPRSKPKVIWWKQIGNDHFQTLPRKRVGADNETSAFCNLLSVTIQDSGVYHCGVIYQGIGQINGTGSHLFVHVSPVPLKITSRLNKENSPVSLTLLCETVPFYPEDFTLAWYINGSETTVGINTNKVQNSEGLYEVSSSLAVSRPPSSNTMYTCSVSHVSLKTPAVVVHTIFTLSGDQQDSINSSLIFWTPICAAVGFSFLVLVTIIVKRYGLRSNRNEGECTRQPDRRDKEAPSEGVQYTAVEFNRGKRTPRRIFEVERSTYAEVAQDAVANKVTYTALKLNSAMKPEKYHHPKEGIEYAALQTGRRKGTEDNYAPARNSKP